MKIALIWCSKSKLSKITKAYRLYTWALFIKSVKFAEKYYDDWFILSAKHYLIDKNDIVEPYNYTLVNQNEDILKNFWSIISKMIMSKFPNDDIYILAWKNYYKYINIPNKIYYPLENLPLWKRLQFLNKI